MGIFRVKMGRGTRTRIFRDGDLDRDQLIYASIILSIIKHNFSIIESV